MTVVLSAWKVRGDLPFQKFRAALDSATFPGECSKDDVSSVLADIIAHMGQDVSLPSLAFPWRLGRFY